MIQIRLHTLVSYTYGKQFLLSNTKVISTLMARLRLSLIVMANSWVIDKKGHKNHLYDAERYLFSNTEANPASSKRNS